MECASRDDMESQNSRNLSFAVVLFQDSQTEGLFLALSFSSVRNNEKGNSRDERKRNV